MLYELSDKRLARWIDEFQGFDLDIRYRRGKDAIVPDALSRRPDYFAAILENDKYNNFMTHLKEYLINKVLPRDPLMFSTMRTILLWIKIRLLCANSRMETLH